MLGDIGGKELGSTESFLRDDQPAVGHQTRSERLLPAMLSIRFAQIAGNEEIIRGDPDVTPLSGARGPVVFHFGDRAMRGIARRFPAAS
jgi:hypothetical protein